MGPRPPNHSPRFRREPAKQNVPRPRRSKSVTLEPINLATRPAARARRLLIGVSYRPGRRLRPTSRFGSTCASGLNGNMKTLFVHERFGAWSAAEDNVRATADE